MNLHEYQAKALFAEYGLPVSSGRDAASSEEAVAAARDLGGERWVIKVQAHAGGRGKAGGVKVVESLDEIRAFADQWLGQKLVTAQTGAEGQLVSRVYVEPCIDIHKELYLGAVVDRNSRRVAVMASTEGGVEIEEVARRSPALIHTREIPPLEGAQPYQGRALAFQLGLTGGLVAQFTNLYLGLTRLFQEKDCALLEINPLVVTASGDLHCLDAKINIDGNALFRQPEISDMRDWSQEDPREAEAAMHGLNYVVLDGNIGCMVNGAGLAMGTMDLVKLYGGEPANFLDVGGAADKGAVAEAFKIILADTKVRCVLINIFGGIVSCAVIAEGILSAVTETGVGVPVVVRFEGNEAERGRAVLSASKLNVLAVESLEGAAQQAALGSGAAV